MTFPFQGDIVFPCDEIFSFCAWAGFITLYLPSHLSPSTSALPRARPHRSLPGRAARGVAHHYCWFISLTFLTCFQEAASECFAVPHSHGTPRTESVCRGCAKVRERVSDIRWVFLFFLNLNYFSFFNYSWHTILCYFQVYTPVIRQHITKWSSWWISYQSGIVHSY